MKKLLKIFIVCFVVVSLTVIFSGCTNSETKDDYLNDKITDEDANNPNADDKKEPKKTESGDTVNIVIEVKDYGTIKAELYPEIAPITVENFVKLIEDEFFDGLIFHRVIKGFMLQGGGFDEKFTQKEAESIKGEFSSNGVDNNLKHEKGVLSMARTSVKDSASSQFFIMHSASPHLDGDYAGFGMVTDGIDVVDKIAKVKTDAQDSPTVNVVISSIRITE